jgi:hypothetical protein
VECLSGAAFTLINGWLAFLLIFSYQLFRFKIICTIFFREICIIRLNEFLMKRFFLSLFCICIICTCFSQIFPPADYPQGYFRNPLHIPISLAGNFGELRPNHYHMGLDIRTEKRVNLPVYAAADGYIAKIKIEPEGFGQAIYINHPNGYTTVYAHLNEFFPALSAYVKEQQYKNESWRLFISIPPGAFPVKKGDFIAYSGSTGGSEAPHVHFEIRNTASDMNYNPLLFGLPVIDNTKPTLLKLAVYDGTRSIYEQTPRILPVGKTAKGYQIGGGMLISRSRKIGFAIAAFDTESGTPNRNGIYRAVLYEDDKPVIGFEMNNISYENTRDINAHIDYKTKAQGGAFLQQLFHLSGYTGSIYHPSGTDGLIDLGDGTVHFIKIEVRDPFGNVSVLGFSVSWRPLDLPQPQWPGKNFYPQMLDGFETEDCAFYIGEKCLYDSVHIPFIKTDLPNDISNIYSIGAIYIPLRDSFLVRIKPNPNFPVDKKDRVVMLRFAGTRRSVEKVSWQNGWASANFRDFGNFQLVLDEEPPRIVPVGFSDGANMSRASRIVILIRDNMDVFKHFRAELDGKWLRFSNDKGKSFIYRFDEHCPPGKHVLKISVEDEAGNQTVKTFGFTR